VALRAGERLLTRRGVRTLQPLNLLMQRLLDLDVGDLTDAFEPIEDDELRERLVELLPVDFHAGFFETSIALHYAPDTVSGRFRELPPCPEIVPEPALERASKLARRSGRSVLARELHLMAVGLGWSALRPFPAYTSLPSLARADVGERLARHIVTAYAESARAVFAGAAPPRPILSWLRVATLGGRIPGLSVPLDHVARMS
jgi:creatinine amidohydrolase